MSQSLGVPSETQGESPCPPGWACLPLPVPTTSSVCLFCLLPTLDHQAEQPSGPFPARTPILLAVSRRQLLPMLGGGSRRDTAGGRGLATAMSEILFKTTGRASWSETIPSWRHCSSASWNRPATSFLCVSYTPSYGGGLGPSVFISFKFFFFFCLSCSFGVLWATRACPLLKGLGHRVLGTTWTGSENEEEESGITPDSPPPTMRLFHLKQVPGADC